VTARYVIGDVFDVLATLEPNSVDLVFSSPPFLALRSYLPADHEHKAKEIGSEATPADFLDTLLDVVEACDRVLAPHGSLCFELGDTFSGSGGAGGDYADEGLRDGQPKFNGSASRRRKHSAEDRVEELLIAAMAEPQNYDEEIVWLCEEILRLRGFALNYPLDKSLCLIPTLFAASLAYGRNLLRPERETPRWRIRNLVVWARPNPPVGALGDKFRPATSYLTVATKSRGRYFDLDAVRTPHQHGEATARGSYSHGEIGNRRAGGDDQHGGEVRDISLNPAGAPPLDYLVLPTQPYRGSHYAVFPEKLVVPFLKSMCPPGGTVLDPFAGSGTVGMVATGHDRNAVLIDLDERNAELARERIGMFLSVEHLAQEKSA
jgi:DNA modification methylase